MTVVERIRRRKKKRMNGVVYEQGNEVMIGFVKGEMERRTGKREAYE